MAEYNIYRIYRIDGPFKWFLYIGMTERSYEERWEEHKRAVDGVYRKNCPGGKKGEIRNPETPYGREANKPLYHFIRNECNGIDGLDKEWGFEAVEGNDTFTEDLLIEMAVQQGHILYNMKNGEGEYVSRRTNVDLSSASDIKEAVKIKSEYDAEIQRVEQQKKADELNRRKLEEERLRQEQIERERQEAEYQEMLVKMEAVREEREKRERMERKAKNMIANAKAKRLREEKKKLAAIKAEKEEQERKKNEQTARKVAEGVVVSFRIGGHYFDLCDGRKTTKKRLVDRLSYELSGHPTTEWEERIESILEVFDKYIAPSIRRKYGE